ncbi:MAG: ribosomal-processing cysteine protease Prp [Oscillospiraceae bacterium]|nr:ribosomal-processing cysteine protease Prp [Oscillospiraceae bacterium]
MIFIIVAKLLIKDNMFLGFDVNGHSEHSEPGEYDIVCAAVSSAACMAANTITGVLLVKAHVSLEKNNGALYFRALSGDLKATHDVLKGFEIHLLEIAKEYSNSLLVKTERLI